jgi:hypothetical protein
MAIYSVTRSEKKMRLTKLSPDNPARLADHLARFLRRVAIRLPSFQLTNFSGALTPVGIGRADWVVGFTMDFKVLGDEQKAPYDGMPCYYPGDFLKQDYPQIEEKLAAEIFASIEQSEGISRMFKWGLNNIDFGVQPIEGVRADCTEGLRVHFRAQGHDYTFEGGEPNDLHIRDLER